MKNYPIEFWLLENLSVSTKEALFETVAKDCFNKQIVNSSERLYSELMAREKDGSTMIAEEFALPHIESEDIQKSALVLVQLGNDSIPWDQGFSAKTIFFLLLKPTEALENKVLLTQLMKKFAYDENLQKLASSSKKDIEKFLF